MFLHVLQTRIFAVEKPIKKILPCTKALVEGEVADPPKLGVVQNKSKNTMFRSYERDNI
jgi:hypothetical protein